VNHSTKPPTKAQQERFTRILDFGCVCCYVDGTDVLKAYGAVQDTPHQPCEIHHMLRGNKRIGHDASIGLCAVHHRGVSSLSRADRLIIYGPSWHLERRAFRERYGSDQDMIDMQNELIGVSA
jgi:hypothetical protein